MSEMKLTRHEVERILSFEETFLRDTDRAQVARALLALDNALTDIEHFLASSIETHYMLSVHVIKNALSTRLED